MVQEMVCTLRRPVRVGTDLSGAKNGVQISQCEVGCWQIEAAWTLPRGLVINDKIVGLHP